MIKFENTEVMGWEHAIRGMRNPLNSWNKSDSEFLLDIETGKPACIVGENDMDLMKRLRDAGSDHRKYLRMITVYTDITAPLYWWKEFDTYKVGTVANSCSTMHKVADKAFEVSDFSVEHLETISRFYDEDKEHEYHYKPYMILREIVDCLEACRQTYLKTKEKVDWWQMIQLLPSSYNQKRTVQLDYEVIRNMYHARRDHKLDEWSIGFVKWVKDLPYSNLITG